MGYTTRNPSHGRYTTTGALGNGLNKSKLALFEGIPSWALKGKPTGDGQNDRRILHLPSRFGSRVPIFEPHASTNPGLKPHSTDGWHAPFNPPNLHSTNRTRNPSAAWSLRTPGRLHSSVRNRGIWCNASRWDCPCTCWRASFHTVMASDRHGLRRESLRPNIGPRQ